MRGQHSSDVVEVGIQHVDTDHLDSGITLGTKILEETGEGLGFAILEDTE